MKCGFIEFAIMLNYGVDSLRILNSNIRAFIQKERTFIEVILVVNLYEILFYEYERK